MARGGNYAKACGLFREKYLRGPQTRNCPPPGQFLQLPAWGNAENAPGTGDLLGLTPSKGKVIDIFDVTYARAQEIKAGWLKKCGVGLLDANEQFIAQFEQKSAQIFL